MTVEERAEELHHQGYNCAQSVLMTLQAHTGMAPKVAADVAAGFGGGVRCGEICGAISGAVMASGVKHGTDNRPRIDALDRKLTAAFREEFGALRCEELKASGCSCDALIRFAATKMDEYLAR